MKWKLVSGADKTNDYIYIYMKIAGIPHDTVHMNAKRGALPDEEMPRSTLC